MLTEDDVFSTWGREFATAVMDFADACGHDGYEVYLAVFGKAPILDSFRKITDAQLVALRDAAREWLETDAIEIGHVARAVEETLWHWHRADRAPTP